MPDQPMLDRIKLGTTKIEISPLGIGTWSWGDKLFWQYGKAYTADDVREAFDTSLAHGINWFDTAEIYGMGQSETLLGQLAKTTDQHVVIATKFFPYPWRLGRRSHLGALRKSLRRMDLKVVDLYQNHWAIPPRSYEVWVQELAAAVELGLTRAVGVSNYDKPQTQNSYDLLKSRGIPLASNQVHYSLLNRKVEMNGLLAYCQEFNITLIAYSPLEMGMLTGKYTPESPPPGVRARRYTPSYLQRITPLLDLMREIGAGHGSKTPAQVALNWVICKGAVPIAGAKNARQARDNAGALGWRLTSEEMRALDKTSAGIEAP